jgi:urease accessory protein
MIDQLAIVRLLQLASPTLPVGSYTYSQGLEWAVEFGDVQDEATTLKWIEGLLTQVIGQYEVPLLAALITAWDGGDQNAAKHLNEEFLASRETAELRAETVQMGYSLRYLATEIPDLQVHPAVYEMDKIAYPTIWAAWASAWQIPGPAAVQAFVWSWCESQVMAAIKTVPLGQSAGQRLLIKLGASIPAIVLAGFELPQDAWNNFAPGYALACCSHETQYTRLFRS